MTDSCQAALLSEGLPAATISGSGRLVFSTSQDFDRAWDLGVFYLKVPTCLDIEGAR
ncbi:MAG: isopenicillin N synthase family oxygenase, partial [Halieaceae bacterium]|nr:isopenicillin N synthase family oxygenase [Halieaceae bacterium]